MAETGRNAPCPCGSGKKYKLCCLPKDDPSFQLDTDRRRTVTSAASAPHTSRPPRRRRRKERTGVRRTPPRHQIIWDDDPLEDLTNGVLDHINAGRFDEAEAGIARLRDEFPEVIDWLDRSAMLAEARGDKNTAAHFYRQALAFTYRPDQYDGFDDDGRSWMIDKIKELDPDGPPPPGPQESPTP